MSSMEIKPQSNKEPPQQQTTNSSSPIPSPSSSPSHEFSFTLSLHSSTTTNTPLTKPLSSNSLPSKLNKQQQPPPSPLGIDLTPADELFFHGHLLPLHFLSHLHSTCPRLSTHSSDNFALQVPDYLLRDETSLKNNLKSDNSSSITCASEDDYCISFNKHNNNNSYNYNNNEETNDIIINCSSQESTNTINCNNDTKHDNNNKSKPSFSLFRLSKWKKSENNNNNKARKVKFELSQILMRYIKMVKPLLQGGGNKRGNDNYKGRRQSYSFSGTVSPRDYSESLRARRGEYSAPASMRTSPTNSGLLMATSGVPSPVNDSTMEELQAAIQAAIAHCKNSSITIQDNKDNNNNNDNNENNNNNSNSGSVLKSQEVSSSIAVN